ncbi:hypothetical protein C4577_02740 [Candidatus Parcubacteria bacterium]|nr:MAG: hypothetical protein C4577_02740 [Candidatus Parcubacteria bacterium]
MPDIFVDDPVLNEMIQKEYGPTFKERRGGVNQKVFEWDHASFGRAKEMINKTEEELEKRHPGKKLLRELALDFYFGPYRLDERYVRGEEITDSREAERQKVWSARIQALAINSIYRAFQDDSDERFVGEIYKTVQNFQNIVSILNLGGVEHGVARMWNAIKSELAIIRVLEDARYDIIIPKYTNDIDDVSSENELLEWDVRNGIDFFAVGQDEILLIDSKGRRMYSKNDPHNRKGIRKEVDVVSQGVDLDKLPLSVKEIIDGSAVKRVRKMVIYVPTEGEVLGRFRWDKVTSRERKQELKSFGRLHPLFANQMADRIKSNGRAEAIPLTYGGVRG